MNFSTSNSYDNRISYNSKKNTIPFLGSYEAFGIYDTIFIYAYLEGIETITDTIVIEFSNDNNNSLDGISTETYTFTNGSNQISILPRLKYFRINISSNVANCDIRKYNTYLSLNQILLTDNSGTLNVNCYGSENKLLNQDISGVLNVNVLTTQPISGNVIMYGNKSLPVNQSDIDGTLFVTVSGTPVVTVSGMIFDNSGNLKINLDNINSNFITQEGLRTYVTNDISTPIPVTISGTQTVTVSGTTTISGNVNCYGSEGKRFNQDIDGTLFVDANITNTLLDVSVSNFPIIQSISGFVDANITNSSLDVNVLNTGLPITNAKLDNLQFDSFNNLNINLNNLNSNFIDNNGLKVQVQNSSIAVTNGSLSSMTFSTDKLNVVDSDTNTKLTNIYNILNSRGTTQLFNGSISMGGYTNVLNLSSIYVKNLTFYGTQDNNGNVLTILFSNNGSTFYASQYSYSFVVSGNFGFNIQCCPYYICVQSKNACNLTIFLDYC